MVSFHSGHETSEWKLLLPFNWLYRNNQLCVRQYMIKKFCCRLFACRLSGLIFSSTYIWFPSSLSSSLHYFMTENCMYSHMFVLTHALGFGELGTCEFYSVLGGTVGFWDTEVPVVSNQEAPSHLACGGLTPPQNLRTAGPRLPVLSKPVCLSNRRVWRRHLTSLSLSFPVYKVGCSIFG